MPLAQITARGIPVALGADDPLLFGSRLADQYAVARDALGLDDAALAELARSSWRASRAPESAQKAASAAIDAWLAAQPPARLRG